MEKIKTTKTRINNFKTMMTQDISLRTFKPNSMHLASRHSRKRSKPTLKDCQRIKRDFYTWKG